MPIEKEILDFIRRLNDCWTKGNPADLNNYFHHNMVAITPTDKKRLEGRDACVAGWTNFAQNARIHHWKESGHKVQVYGVAAVVTYYFDISFDMGRPDHQHEWPGHVYSGSRSRAVAGGGRPVFAQCLIHA